MDVLIVGAGIAGLNCALRLLRDGHRVTVAEKLRGGIDKVCGEGLLPFGVDLLHELGLAEEVRRAGRPYHGIAYHHAGKSAKGRFPDGCHGIGIERGRLDRIFREACTAYPEFRLREGVNLTPGQTEGYNRVIAADGICSKWARAHRVETRHGKRLGLRFRLETAPPDRVEVYFFESCEVYMTPTDDETLSVAFLIDANKNPIQGGQLREWCEGFFQTEFPHLAELVPRELATRGPISARRRVCQPSVHLLGDAYHAFDPITGAGMSFALLCGKLAAHHLDSPADYYASLKPAIRSIGSFTNAVLFFRGGGIKTKLMMRQLVKSPKSFNRILAIHDGHHQFTDIGLSAMMGFLKIV